MKRLIFLLAGVLVPLSSGALQASSVFVGSLADWIADPVQVAGDKVFTYVDSSGGWSGDELVTISSNIPQNSETVSIDGLSDYIGPQNLMLAYSAVISSTDVFLSLSLDQNFSGSSATTYKDIFTSLEDLQANPVPGTGTWSLSVIDAGTGTTVSLPPLQGLWIRDTIVLDASGSVLSISNTAVQVPEPHVLAATILCAIGTFAVRRERRRLVWHRL
jgi:hypothetical protein